MQFGARLRALRQRRGMTLADLAGDQLSVGLVSKIERDLVNPSLHTLGQLARRLGVPPGALLDSGVPPAYGALCAARARLLLGDPAAAASEALGAARDGPAADGEAGADAGLGARLLAVAAEAALAGGDSTAAALHVRNASALVSPSGDTAAARAGGVASRAEVLWVLGALERRRGALADAERSWTTCLAALEQPPDASPWWTYLRATVLAELGGLAEARGDAELARNLVARAASIAAGVAQAVGPASALLTDWSLRSASAPDTAGPDQLDAPPAGPYAALALAVVSAAERLSRRLALEAARLERTAWSPTARAPDVPTTRGLR